VPLFTSFCFFLSIDADQRIVNMYLQLTMLLMLLQVLDVVLTMYLGCGEANPLVRPLLENSPRLLIVVKVLLAYTVGLLCCLDKKVNLLIFVCVVYSLLVLTECAFVMCSFFYFLEKFFRKNVTCS